MRWENDRELDYVPTQYCIPMTPLQLEEREKENCYCKAWCFLDIGSRTLEKQ